MDFNFHVKPILSDKLCFACHGIWTAKREKPNLRLDINENTATKSNEKHLPLMI